MADYSDCKAGLKVELIHVRDNENVADWIKIESRGFFYGAEWGACASLHCGSEQLDTPRFSCCVVDMKKCG